MSLWQSDHPTGCRSGTEIAELVTVANALRPCSKSTATKTIHTKNRLSIKMGKMVIYLYFVVWIATRTQTHINKGKNGNYSTIRKITG